MKTAGARKVPVGKQRRPVYIFTDGSCEPDPRAAAGLTAGYGAVMFDPEDGALGTFGGYLQPDLMHILTDGGNMRQIVGQSELVPCVAAKQVWRKRLRGRLVIHCVDNAAAQYGLFKGTSSARDSAWLVNGFWASRRSGVPILDSEGFSRRRIAPVIRRGTRR